jgi:hypothetical protein
MYRETSTINLSVNDCPLVAVPPPRAASTTSWYRASLLSSLCAPSL